MKFKEKLNVALWDHPDDSSMLRNASLDPIGISVSLKYLERKLTRTIVVFSEELRQEFLKKRKEEDNSAY